MARGGYRMWAKSDRHQADYTLRQIRKALAKAIARNDATDISVCQAAEARAIEEVNRVESEIAALWRGRFGSQPKI